jgi:hypothetical protein
MIYSRPSPATHSFARGGNLVRTHLLLRFSEFEDELIRLAANRWIFHVGGSRIASIVKQVTLALEPEAGGFHFRRTRNCRRR